MLIASSVLSTETTCRSTSHLLLDCSYVTSLIACKILLLNYTQLATTFTFIFTSHLNPQLKTDTMPPSTRKQQARIHFNPLPSSAPAAQGYNKQIQDRAAAVSYGDSSSSQQQPRKRRKLQPTGTRNKDHASSQTMLAPHANANANTMLPTPAEAIAPISDAPSESASTSTQRKSKRRAAKQQQLDFGPSSGTVNLDPPTGPNMFTKHRGQKRAADFSSEDDSDEVPTSSKLAKRKKGGSKRKEEEASFMSPEGNKVKKSRKRKEATPPEDEDEEDEDEIVVTSARKMQLQPTPQEEEDEDEDEDEVVVPSARKPRRPTQQVVEDEDSEDELPTIGTQRRRRQRQPSILSSSPPAETAGSEDDLQIIEDPGKKKSKKKRVASEDDEDEQSEEEDVAPRTPGRRLLQRRGRQMTQQEQEDLDEDMDFIGPSSDVDDDRAPRDSQTIKKNARLQALERLKQVRSSQKTGLPDIQEAQEDAEEDDATSQQDLDELYNNSDETPEPVPTSSRAMFAAASDDEDFIEEGENDTLGVPDGIPLAFTRYASMKAKDLWKFAIEWFVQKKINPAFAMDDEIYTLTFQKLDDEVSGLVGSKFASSAWTGDFTIALRSRPEIAYTSIDRNSAEHAYRDKCDACNRSGHPATREVQFQGKPYNRQTLDEVVSKDDSDSESSDGNDSDSAGETADDRPAYDASGRLVPPANKTWYVGKFCMSNARTAHALHHWRYHLYEWVVIWIDGKGYGTNKELKKRDQMSTKKRRKYANKIVDRMVEDGVVKKLWKEFRGTIDEAKDAKQGRFEAGSP